MENKKHTPGPWKMSADGWAVTSKRDGILFQSMYSNNEGNARLCAAAPELLEALETAKRMINEVEEHRFTGADLIQINKAIAKAKGQ